MRGIKTFPLRMERHCLERLPRGVVAERASPGGGAHVFPGDPNHPDASAIRRLFPPDLFGAMVSFEIRGAGRRRFSGSWTLCSLSCGPPHWAMCTAWRSIR